VHRIKPIEFENGTVQIDASIIADGLGLALPRLQKEMRAGKITSFAERGIDADSGRHRLTFFSKHRRFASWSTKQAQSFSARPSTSGIRRCRTQCASPADETSESAAGSAWKAGAGAGV
jgi:hypothetical protein